VISDRWIGSDNFKVVASRLSRLKEQPQLTGLPDQFSSIESQCFHTMFHTPHDALICAPEQQALKRLALLAIARALNVDSDQAKQVLVIAHRKPIARQLGAFLNRSLKVFSARIAVLVEPSDISRYSSSSIDSLEVVVMTPKLGSVMPVSFYQNRALTILMDLHNVNQDYQQVINTILQNHRPPD